MEHGTDEEVLDEIIKIKGITESSLVYGEYDIHCKIEVDDIWLRLDAGEKEGR